MAAIRSMGNTTTEQRLASMLRRYHLSGWRRHMKLPGTPDFVFTKERVAVFVNGCFWHGCPRCYRRPRANQPYWQQKVERNRTRDRRVKRTLRASGWSVLSFWEHSLRSEGAVVGRIRKALERRRQ
ncbi:MAG: DNA mismatch endonuclease Vsr [Chloroflexi bacterium]|nr:DNA mismatch endonuclease Vsr [Chloroflexota bacterium]